ncbi:hypothetical protein KR222_001616 [Zaprionus bogoriensis]|nr:hypothetical protein KR222_001616 [Zaprionus bogoriensis]
MKTQTVSVLCMAILNFGYSMAYILVAVKDMTLTDDNDEFQYLWLGIYIANVCLNLYVCVRVGKGDQYSILMWLAFTLIVFLFRIFAMSYDLHGYWFFVISMLVNMYIFGTLIIMAILFKIMDATVELDRGPQIVAAPARPKPQLFGWNVPGRTAPALTVRPSGRTTYTSSPRAYYESPSSPPATSDIFLEIPEPCAPYATEVDMSVDTDNCCADVGRHCDGGDTGGGHADYDCGGGDCGNSGGDCGGGDCGGNDD